MWGNVDSVVFKSGLVENMGVEVKITSLSQAVQKLLPLPFFPPPSWISGGRRRRIFPVVAPLKFISTSGLAVTILNYGNQPTSGNVRSGRDVSGRVANVGVAIGIVSPAHCVQ